MNEDLKSKLQQSLEQVKDKLAVKTAALDGFHLTDDNMLMVSLAVNPDEGAKLEDLRQSLQAELEELSGIKGVSVVLTAERSAQPKGVEKTDVSDKDMQARPIAPHVKNIIAVASGKGGVGKSTVAANLALAFADAGYKTGLVDADIYGPSQHRMMGVFDRIEGTSDRTLTPLKAHGIQFISIGSMVDEDRPLVWRGPMVQTAVLQFFRDVIWGDMDVLVVDLPPGTGDAQMTLAQKVPLTGAVIVSTPQDVAMIDARKAINMFEKMDIPILGIIENMSQHTCSNCGHTEHIFGHHGAEKEAKERNVPFLGALPLDLKIRKTSDEGTPIYSEDKYHPASQIFKEMVPTLLGLEKAA
tara:strand:- start:28 stop:1095 length:1068 start_codon:yes stop_codon:yes gene_type:complete